MQSGLLGLDPVEPVLCSHRKPVGYRASVPSWVLKLSAVEVGKGKARNEVQRQSVGEAHCCQSFILYGLSNDWMRPNHIVQSNALFKQKPSLSLAMLLRLVDNF